ncbi:MAG: hypothetical protein WCG87_05465 [Bacteroidota bacterium]
MKKIFLPALCFLFALSIISCSEKFNVAAPYKSVTVVYGLLNMSDTAQYIRIQKSFLDENKSALVMAQNPDSNYNARIIVVIKELSSSYTISTDTLHRVDLNKEGYPKDSGVFFSSVNYAYKYKHPLNADYTYRLVITDTGTGVVDSAETVVISNDPSAFVVKDFEAAYPSVRSPFNFTHIFPSQSAYTLRTIVPLNVQVLSGIIRFNWVDSNLVSLKGTPKYADFDFCDKNFGANTTSPTNVSLSNLNTNFYDFLASSIGTPSDPSVVRYLTGCDFTIYAATSDFYTYQQVQQTESGGLTSEEIKPNYTNIKGKDVIGLFTCRCTRSNPYKMYIYNETVDSLMASPLTSALQIRGQISH